MTAVVIDVEQGTREWLEARRQGIGASDIASVLGANPWQSGAPATVEGC